MGFVLWRWGDGPVYDGGVQGAAWDTYCRSTQLETIYVRPVPKVHRSSSPCGNHVRLFSQVTVLQSQTYARTPIHSMPVPVSVHVLAYTPAAIAVLHEIGGANVRNLITRQDLCAQMYFWGASLLLYSVQQCSACALSIQCLRMFFGWCQGECYLLLSL